MDNQYRKYFNCSVDTCRSIETEEVKILLWGVIFVLEDNVLISDISTIAEKVIKNNISFCDIHGFYKIVIEQRQTGDVYFWGDNIGSQRFFIDKENKTVSDSFLKLKELRDVGKYNPNYNAILYFLMSSSFLTNETLIANIETTDISCFYKITDGKLESYSKKLPKFNSNREVISLEKLMMGLTLSMDDRKISTVLTGGTDSRTVLSHLIHQNYRPRCFLSGRLQNPDIVVAQKIADKLNLPLTVYNPDERSDNWLKDGYVFSDAIYDAVLSYRHLMLVKSAKASGCVYQFGGVGGEFYKNAFCRAIRKRYYLKHVTSKTLFNDILSLSAPLSNWYGDSMRSAFDNVQQTAFKMVKENDCGNLLCRCNSIGFAVLSRKVFSITNNYARYCVKLDPLMDIDVITDVCRKSFFTNVMQVWQRKQITKYCPQIAGMTTDQRKSCSMKITKLLHDSFISLSQYVNLAVHRIIKKRKKVDYWDNDYYSASQTEIYRNSLERCRSMGIIAKDIDETKIPLQVRGCIITVGTLFEN